jgi:hypothetical protein
MSSACMVLTFFDPTLHTMGNSQRSTTKDRVLSVDHTPCLCLLRSPTCSPSQNYRVSILRCDAMPSFYYLGQGCKFVCARILNLRSPRPLPPHTGPIVAGIGFCESLGPGVKVVRGMQPVVERHVFAAVGGHLVKPPCWEVQHLPCAIPTTDDA